MQVHWKKIVLTVAGVLFLILGVLGLVLPFLQGILFIIVGCILLSIASKRIRGWLEMHTTRYPKVHELVVKTEARIIRIIGPIDE